MTSVDALSVRLARVALEADRLLLELAAASLTAADALLLSAPAAHLQIAAFSAAQIMFEISYYGESPWPRVAESDRLAA